MLIWLPQPRARELDVEAGVERPDAACLLLISRLEGEELSFVAIAGEERRWG